MFHLLVHHRHPFGSNFEESRRRSVSLSSTPPFAFWRPNSDDGMSGKSYCDDDVLETPSNPAGGSGLLPLVENGVSDNANHVVQFGFQRQVVNNNGWNGSTSTTSSSNESRTRSSSTYLLAFSRVFPISWATLLTIYRIIDMDNKTTITAVYNILLLLFCFPWFLIVWFSLCPSQIMNNQVFFLSFPLIINESFSRCESKLCFSRT